MRALGFVFSEDRLLKQALTHRSAGSRHNERLEFIGDGVLNATVARALYVRFPELSEGELSRLRASLVCQDALAIVANRLQLGDYLHLGEGELKSGGHRRPSILADALEAIFGAIWLDAGFDAAEQVVLRLMTPAIEAIDPATAGKDAKTGLQEWLQARKLATPQYVLVNLAGESPNQVFECACRIAVPEMETRAEGPSRRVAEQAAAKLALDDLMARYPGKAKKFDVREVK
ncbi:ribonuclease III [Chitinibacteraceae bacterium HSL-7]